jgi:hypothetical protein
MKSLFTILCLFLTLNIFAQLTGRVTDEKGEGLPSASVYIEGSTQGTTTNDDGFYTLDLPKGNYRIAFQYVGYTRKMESVVMDNKLVLLNISLKPASFEIGEFVIKANAEDPAYPIMRKAIQQRSYFKDQVKGYTCDVYIKGMQKALKAPKAIFGRQLGDMGGSLDSNRQGILYLSETISKYSVQNPNDKKEVLISSKVSGRDNGFGFNRASLFDFSFYDNHIQIQKTTLSPIAENAMAFYKYRLVGTAKDDKGNSIKKIEVIPKISQDPTWAGYIYIVDNQWNIQALDLYLTGKSLNTTFLDTIRLKQDFVPVQAPDVWRMISQNLTFQFGIFGLQIKGNFSGVYSNYKINPTFEKGFFTNEIFKATKGKDDNSYGFWDTIRPMPLTVEEGKDYIKKDSIQKVRETKQYKDSVDVVRNKFKFFDILLGYTHQNTYKKSAWSIGAPLLAFTFNPVQGGNFNLPFNYRQDYGEHRESSVNISPRLSYGFAEQIFRGDLSLSKRFNKFDRSTLTLSGGQKLAQLNEDEPISDLLSENYNLFGKKNYLLQYQKTYATANYTGEIANGIYMNSGLSWEQRSHVNVNSQYSWNKRKELYPANEPINIHQADIPEFKPNTALKFNLGFDFVFQQKFLSYPWEKRIEDREESAYPKLSVQYSKALAMNTDWMDYDKIKLGLNYEHLSLGLLGYSEVKLEVGSFLTKKNVQFTDYNHFLGNQTEVIGSRRYMDNFLDLPYYQFSTTGTYFMAHWQHNFEGFLFNRVPLIKKLGWTETIRVAYLNTPDLQNFVELSFGIGNIGFDIYRLGRLDIVTHYQDGKFSSPSLVLGFGF